MCSHKMISFHMLEEHTPCQYELKTIINMIMEGLFLYFFILLEKKYSICNIYAPNENNKKKLSLTMPMSF